MNLWNFGKTGAVLIITSALTACGGGAPGSYDSELNRKTAGVAVISSFAQMCGVGGIQQYRQSYINYMKGQRQVNPEAEQKIWDMFTRADAGIPSRFPTAAYVQNRCTTYGTGADSIQRGIAGDFTGQI